MRTIIIKLLMKRLISLVFLFTMMMLVATTEAA